MCFAPTKVYTGIGLYDGTDEVSAYLISGVSVSAFHTQVIRYNDTNNKSGLFTHRSNEHKRYDFKRKWFYEEYENVTNLPIIVCLLTVAARKV